MEYMRPSKNQFVPFGIILGISLVLATGIGALTAYSIKGLENTIAVTGSAKTDVTADSVKFSFGITRTVPESQLGVGTAALDKDLVLVKEFLAANQIPESEITIAPVMTNQIYDNNSSVVRYAVQRTITINSTRVDAISVLAQNVSSLTSKGVLVQATIPEYYYSKLSDLRVSLLGEALKDAKARADAIAIQSKQHVGRLKSSTSGVVQILAPNSVDVSDYGQYDTSSVKKTVMVTVRATFQIQ